MNCRKLKQGCSQGCVWVDKFDVLVICFIIYIILLLCLSIRVFVHPSSASMFSTAHVKRYPRTSDKGWVPSLTPIGAQQYIYIEVYKITPVSFEFSVEDSHRNFVAEREYEDLLCDYKDSSICNVCNSVRRLQVLRFSCGTRRGPVCMYISESTVLNVIKGTCNQGANTSNHRRVCHPTRDILVSEDGGSDRIGFLSNGCDCKPAKRRLPITKWRIQIQRKISPTQEWCSL
jgi:hypothetical protein